MPKYCAECGGELVYDKVLKQYACRSCGLTFTSQQLLEDREKAFGRDSSEEEAKKRKQNEYLKWWLSKKT